MSTYFSKLIKAGDRLREFNFRLTSIADTSKYSVDVPDENGRRIVFGMYKNENGEWKISLDLIPTWIHDSESQLAEAIEENYKNEWARKK
jgi:hypothetical protein